MVSSGATSPARAPPSMLMLQIVIRCSMFRARMASPRYSNTCPVPPPIPIRAIRARMMSLALTPGASRPSTRTSYVRGFRWSRVWVARTISTSLVPIPNASAPNAPWVAVCESPHTMVMPGCVSPSSGPMTWTMPWVSLPNAWIGMPNSRQLTSSWLICAAACMSIIGRPRGVVGVEWSAVATVLSGRRTARPRVRSPVKAWGLVTSWTRWRSTARIAGAPGSSATTCASQIFSTSVRGLAVAISAGDVLCGGFRAARVAARGATPGRPRWGVVRGRPGTFGSRLGWGIGA